MWGVWHIICIACGQRWVAVAPIDAEFPFECFHCGVYGGEAMRVRPVLFQFSPNPEN